MSEASPPIPEELHVLAGEYVLGALEAAEMRAVRRQAMVDPSLAAAIAGWEQRLAPMALVVPPVPPPEPLWSRIEQAIAPLPDDATEYAAAAHGGAAGEWAGRGGAPRPRLVSLPPEPPEPPELGEPLAALPRMQPQELPRILPQAPPRRRVWPWQLATAVSFALAAGVGGLVLMPTLAIELHVPMIGERFAPVVAVLMPSEPDRSDGSLPQMASDSGTPVLQEPRPPGAPTSKSGSHMSAYLAEARPDGTLLVSAVTQVEVPSGKTLELWMQPPGAAAPRSLGVLPAAGQRLRLPAMPASGTALMISLEPPGGSPTGAPTGPVVYAGKLGQLQL